MVHYYRVTPTNPPILTLDSTLFVKGDSTIVTQKRALINNPWAQQLLDGLGSTGLWHVPSSAAWPGRTRSDPGFLPGSALNEMFREWNGTEVC